MEITGTTSTNGITHIDMPAGYTRSNTRVLSAKIHSAPPPPFAQGDYYVGYQADGDIIQVYIRVAYLSDPVIVLLHHMFDGKALPYSILLMKIP